MQILIRPLSCHAQSEKRGCSSRWPVDTCGGFIDLYRQDSRLGSQGQQVEETMARKTKGPRDCGRGRVLRGNTFAIGGVVLGKSGELNGAERPARIHGDKAVVRALPNAQIRYFTCTL